MSYLGGRSSGDIPAETIRDLCAILGVPVESDELASLAAAFRAQLAVVERFDARDTDGVDPAVTFDPSWDE